MSDMPPYASPAFGIARPRSSGAAITSLVLGILLCFPLVTSIGAIIFAAVGIKATQSASVRGRGMAIAGLVLGIVGVVGWIGVGLMTWGLIAGSAAPRAVLHDFVAEVASGNLPAATARCDPTIIPPSAVGTLQTDMAKFGTYTDLTCDSVSMSAFPGETSCVFHGVARFSLGSHPFDAILKKDGSGTWKIWGFHIY